MQHLAAINVGNRVPLLNLAQPELSFNISVNKPGPYVIIINYVMPVSDQRTHKVEATVSAASNKYNGNSVLYACPYTTLCRQIVTNQDGSVGVYHTDSNGIKLDLKVSLFLAQNCDCKVFLYRVLIQTWVYIQW